MSPWDYVYNLSNITKSITDNLSGSLGWLAYLLAGVIGALALLGYIVFAQIATTWIERRLIARLQIRWGPNRVGPWGIFQPIADALKALSKEALTPDGADKWVFWAAPILFFVPAMLVWAVLPFGPGMAYTDLNIGLLYVIAVSSLSVIMVFMAGWSSNNKFSLLGAMRAVAMMISYEIPMVLSLVGVLLLVGSLNLTAIVNKQIEMGVWFVLLQPLGVLIFFIASLAELNRTPTDIVEAESEIVAGYHTEYSGMKFALYYATEYAYAMAFCGILATLFFGGWTFPVLDAVIPPWLIFAGKMYFFFCILVWIRGTLPRLRIDQLMNFAWKFLIPLSLFNILFTAIQILILSGATIPPGLSNLFLVLVNLALAWFLIVSWSKLLERRVATT